MSDKNIEIAGGRREDGVVIGNTFDKYGSRNPIVRALMAGFDSALEDLFAAAAPTSVHEVGSGEGYWAIRWAARGIEVRATDFSRDVIDIARANAAREGLDERIFSVKSVYDIERPQDAADLIVCCEVLEHVDAPERALEAIARVAERDVILSVPREPLWRVLNMARGKYISQLGNTPGHLNHWSSRGFVEMAQRYFDVIAVRKPVPWTMLHCRVRTRGA